MKYLLLALFAAALTLAAACGDDDDATVTPSSSTSSGHVSGSITVFAASSLTAAFQQIGDEFTKSNPGAHVEFNFAGSQDLRTQLEQGAGADVFASADAKQMQMAVDHGLITGEPAIFAHNRLVVIVPKANDAHVEKLQDLAKSGVKIVLADESVPVGNYSRQFLDKASADSSFGSGYKDAVLANVVSSETNVKQVVSRIQLDEADAGIVYATDAATVADDVTTIEIPDALNLVADYPIAATAVAGSPTVAQAFIDYVLSAAGQATLQANGFVPVTA